RNQGSERCFDSPKETQLRTCLRSDQTAWLQSLHHTSPELLSKRPNMPALGEWVDSCKKSPSPPTSAAFIISPSTSCWARVEAQQSVKRKTTLPVTTPLCSPLAKARWYFECLRCFPRVLGDHWIPALAPTPCQVSFLQSWRYFCP
ncbi:mCG140677, partial [Mus musculus]